MIAWRVTLPAIVDYAIQQEYILPLKQNLTNLQSLYQVMMLMEEACPEFSGLTEIFDDLCSKFQFHTDNLHLKTLLQQGKPDEVLLLLKADLQQGNTRIWKYCEQYYNYLILKEPLLNDYECPSFDINTLMQWYQSIELASPYYNKANHRLYNLYLTHSNELNSQESKTQLFKFALRSGDSELIDKAFNSLCGFEFQNQFKSIKGDEANLIELAHYIYSQNQQIMSLEAKNGENKTTYASCFFTATKTTEDKEDKQCLRLS